MTDMTFAATGLAAPLLRTLMARGHDRPTPIQAQAIPELLRRKDLLGIAQTGTGKTGAFSLPILHHLHAWKQDEAPRGPRAPKALILAPTRELAIQIGAEMRAYGQGLGLKQTVIYGGVSQQAQITALARGVDIVIATPGRLLDLHRQRKARFDQITFYVLDEADRMLDMGFVNDIRKITAALPRARQSLLFSATMAPPAAKIAKEVLHDPVRVEVTPQATPIERIDQKVFRINNDAKTPLLVHILEDAALTRVIVFTRTKHRANKLAMQLNNVGIDAAAFHGNKSQNARQQALGRFTTGDCRVLVATDIAARGIDINDVSHVINFDLPNEPESYVHRIGRTARAGAAGIAWSFCDRSERPYLEDIKRLIRANIPLVEQIPNLPKLAPLSAQDLRAAASADAPHRNRSRKPSPQNRSKTQDRTDAARRPARHNERPGGQVRAADRPAPRQAVKPVAKAGPKRRPKHAGKAGTKAVTDHAKAPKKETKGALRMEKSGQNLGKSRRRGPSKPGQRPRKPGTPPCPEGGTQPLSRARRRPPGS